MTQQTKMPEPVAYAIFAENGNIRLWSTEPCDLPDLDSLGPMHQLITTTQTEAYAAAKVREAMEANFDKSFALLSAWMRSTQVVADMGQVATLCSLVDFALVNQIKTAEQLELEFRLPPPPQDDNE